MPLTPSNRRAEESSGLSTVLHVSRMARGRCQKALPWVAQFATKLCRENRGTLLTCLGVKNLCTLLLAARLSDNPGKPFWQSDFFGGRQAAQWRRHGILWTLCLGLWSAPSSRAMCHFLAFCGKAANLPGKAHFCLVFAAKISVTMAIICVTDLC